MITLPAQLVAASAAVVLLLGSVHLLYTFRGPKLLPRDPTLIEHMKAVTPVLTRETTVWKAWIGFNASHSGGAILFGLVYGYLALEQQAMLFSSGFLLALGLVFLASYILLAKLYWFRIPLVGLLLSTGLYAAALLVRFSG